MVRVVPGVSAAMLVAIFCTAAWYSVCAASRDGLACSLCSSCAGRLSSRLYPSLPYSLTLRPRERSTAELADLFGVARSTVYRAQQRHQAAARP